MLGATIFVAPIARPWPSDRCLAIESFTGLSQLEVHDRSRQETEACGGHSQADETTPAYSVKREPETRRQRPAGACRVTSGSSTPALQQPL